MKTSMNMNLIMPARKTVWSIRDLVDDIRQNGLRKPIHVQKGRGRKYKIRDGTRRYYAMKELGFTEIDVFIEERK